MPPSLNESVFFKRQLGALPDIGCLGAERAVTPPVNTPVHLVFKTTSSTPDSDGGMFIGMKRDEGAERVLAAAAKLRECQVVADAATDAVNQASRASSDAESDLRAAQRLLSEAVAAQK